VAYMRSWLAIALFLALSASAAQAYTYRSSRKLFDDCAAPATLKSGVPTAARQRCTSYLTQVLNAWNLNQDVGVCSTYVGNALADAYVAYWSKRGRGALGGEFRSAERSVNDFLDSQKRPCPARSGASGDPGR
jgi:hypothetical protein